MRTKRFLWLFVSLVSALALTVALSVGSAGATVRTAADQSWTDPAADAQGGAPDITGITISNDAAGTVTVSVTVPIVAQTVVAVPLDTNLDLKSDHDLVAVGVGSGVAVPVVQAPDAAGNWNPVSVPSLKFVASATTLTFSFAKADLGIDQMFTFWAWSATQAQLADPNAPFGDEIPDGNAVFTYAITTPPPPPTPTPTPTPTPAVVTPVIGAPVVVPYAVKAGTSMTVTFPVTRSDNGKPLMSGTMICDPSVSGKVIKHAESFKAGKAKLSFLVPKTAKGKLLKVKVTIKAGTKTATRIATFRIK